MVLICEFGGGGVIHFYFTAFFIPVGILTLIFKEDHNRKFFYFSKATFLLGNINIPIQKQTPLQTHTAWEKFFYFSGVTFLLGNIKIPIQKQNKTPLQTYTAWENSFISVMPLFF